MLNSAARWTLVSVVAVILGLGTVGCGGEVETPPTATVDPPTEPVPSEPAPADPDTPDPPGPSTTPIDSYGLQLLGPTSVALGSGTQRQMQVLYSRNGKGVAGAVVTFTPSGAYADSSLSTYSAVTDSEGFASTVVKAGTVVASFNVEASADHVAPVSLLVEVVQQVGPTTPTATVLDGSYQLTSQINVKTDFAGSKLAEVLNLLEQISDDPEDPGKFIVDQSLSKLQNPTAQVVASVIKPMLYQELNAVLAQTAPWLVPDTIQLAQQISSVARRFELESVVLSTTAQDASQAMVVDHLLGKIAWTVGGKRVAYPLGAGTVAKNVALTPGADGDATLASHTFNIQYGLFLNSAIDSLVVPSIDPSASDLKSLLLNMVDCSVVGQSLSTKVGVGTDQLWGSACETALTAVAVLLETKIKALDSDGGSSLTLQGLSKLRDMDQDGTLDAFNNGEWSGQLELGQCVAPLGGAGNTYWGKLATVTP